jgi:hypothetical protein
MDNQKEALRAQDQEVDRVDNIVDALDFASFVQTRQRTSITNNTSSLNVTSRIPGKYAPAVRQEIAQHTNAWFPVRSRGRAIWPCFPSRSRGCVSTNLESQVGGGSHSNVSALLPDFLDSNRDLDCRWVVEIGAHEMRRS